MPYALITGASKGIGKEIVQQLAEKKCNVLLVSRSEDLLNKFSEEIQEKYKIHAAYFAIDLSKPNAANEVYNWCAQNKYDINILVNNAGYGLSGPFEKYNPEEQQNMMQVNMNVLMSLTLLFLPQLKKQPQSYILNIASTAAYQAVPYLSLYSATKSFVLSFSRGLRYELKNTNVSVTCVCPGGTDTGFGARAQIGVRAIKAGEKLNMQPGDVARIAVKSMYHKKTEVITGFINKLGAFLVRFSPKNLSENIAAKLYKD